MGDHILLRSYPPQNAFLVYSACEERTKSRHLLKFRETPRSIVLFPTRTYTHTSHPPPTHTPHAPTHIPHASHTHTSQVHVYGDGWYGYWEREILLKQHLQIAVATPGRLWKLMSDVSSYASRRSCTKDTVKLHDWVCVCVHVCVYSSCNCKIIIIDLHVAIIQFSPYSLIFLKPFANWRAWLI